MVEFSERERISLLMMKRWGDQQRGYKQVMRLFNETFRNENNRISKTTVVRNVIQRFEESDSVRNRPNSSRQQRMKIKHIFYSLLSKNLHTSVNRVAQ